VAVAQQRARVTAVERRGSVALTRRRDVAVLLGPCLVYLVAFSVFPLLYSLWVSFQRYDAQHGTYHWYGLQNYRELVSSRTFWIATENTAIFTFGAVAFEVLIGVALALFFAQRLRGAALVRGILLLPMLLTPIVVGLMWRALLDADWGLVVWAAGKLGLDATGWLTDPDLAIRTLIAIDVWQWTPFVFFIVYARLQALPPDVFEASAVDGAGWLRNTWHITLPLLAPAIAFAAVFRAIDAFRTFDLVYGLTNGGPGNATRTLSFEAFQSGFSFFRYGYASAVSYVMVLVAMCGVTLLFRVISLRREAE
jgi:multiple sugar transport system permease protein